MLELFEKLGLFSFANSDWDWSFKIKERDGICCYCGSGLNLEAAHIVGRSVIKLRLVIENGITLCSLCHSKATNSAELENIIIKKSVKNIYGERLGIIILNTLYECRY